MRRTLLWATCLAMLMFSCESKKPQETTNIPEKPQAQETVGNQNEGVEECDMVFLDDGKLFFYRSDNSKTYSFDAETDSIVNCVFTGDNMVYYCVAVGEKILLRCVDLNQSDLKPKQLADWGVPYEKCVTETYGTVSPLEYYPGRNKLGIWYDFSWDVYSLSEQKLYNLGTGEITDWDLDTWETETYAMRREEEEQTEENYHYISTRDELEEYLVTFEDNYYYGDDEVCLTDQIDFRKYISDPDYYTGPDFEYISSSPDNMKVLYMVILEWGDYPHGILAVSSIDGKIQMPLEDTDCTGYNAQWLDDGSLVYAGEEPLTPEDPDYDASWHYLKHCIKRIYPDGRVEIISHCGDFQVKQSVVH